jgi:hypothetical protein
VIGRRRQKRLAWREASAKCSVQDAQPPLRELPGIDRLSASFQTACKPLGRSLASPQASSRHPCKRIVGFPLFRDGFVASAVGTITV